MPSMNICPKCNNTMRWYQKIIIGHDPYNGFHCDNCNFDTINNDTIFYTSDKPIYEPKIGESSSTTKSVYNKLSELESSSTNYSISYGLNKSIYKPLSKIGE